MLAAQAQPPPPRAAGQGGVAALSNTGGCNSKHKARQQARQRCFGSQCWRGRPFWLCGRAAAYVVGGCPRPAHQGRHPAGSQRAAAACSQRRSTCLPGCSAGMAAPSCCSGAADPALAAVADELQELSFDPTLDDCCRRDLEEQAASARLRSQLAVHDRSTAAQKLRSAVLGARPVPAAEGGPEPPAAGQQDGLDSASEDEDDPCELLQWLLRAGARTRLPHSCRMASDPLALLPPRPTPRRPSRRCGGAQAAAVAAAAAASGSAAAAPRHRRAAGPARHPGAGEGAPHNPHMAACHRLAATCVQHSHLRRGLTEAPHICPPPAACASGLVRRNWRSRGVGAWWCTWLWRDSR
jgi:hypothetical protein